MNITITKHATQRAMERAGINANVLWRRAKPITRDMAGQYTITRQHCDYYVAVWAWKSYILVVQDETLITVIPINRLEE